MGHKKTRNMKIRSQARLGAMAALLALGVAGPAEAQDAQPPSQGSGVATVLQPFRGLFGGNERNPNARETLDFSASLFGGYDSNVGAAVTGQPSVTAGGSPYWRASATVTYTHDGPRWDVGTTVSGNSNWYQNYPEMDGVGGAFAFGAAYAWSTRTSLSLGQHIVYSPYYSYGLFASVSAPGLGALPPYTPGLAVVNVQTLNVGAKASFTHLLTPRSGVMAQYSFGFTDPQTNLWSNVTSNYVGARYIYKLNDDFGLRAGYAVNHGSYSGAFQNSSYTNQIIDAGVDYNRTLRVTRRTTFGFWVGSTILTNTIPGITGDSQLRFGVVGAANLRHSFRRSWSTELAYSRSVSYSAGLAAPVFADAVSLDLTGYLSDRLRSTSGVGYSHGTVGVGAVLENTLSTSAAYTSLQYAFSERLAADVRYYYYYYDFANRLYLPIGVAQSMRRNGVEAGLTVWLPLVAK